MITWEHTYIIFDVKKGPKVMKESLNTHGEDGWQLCSIINVGGDHLIAFLKKFERPAEKPDPKANEQANIAKLWGGKDE